MGRVMFKYRGNCQFQDVKVQLEIVILCSNIKFRFYVQRKVMNTFSFYVLFDE